MGVTEGGRAEALLGRQELWAGLSSTTLDKLLHLSPEFSLLQNTIYFVRIYED